MAVYILRHGLSEGNAGNYFQGSLDTSLLDLGREQARAAGRWLKQQGVKLSHAYSSPLKRAWHTAELVLQELNGPKPIPVDELREYFAGDLEGMALEELNALEPSYFERPLGERGDFSAWGGETYDQAQTRLTRFRDEIQARHDAFDEVLIVSHGGVMYQLLKLWCGWPTPRHYFTRISNCTCFKLRLREIDGQSRAELEWMVPLALHAPELAERQ